MRVLVVQSLPLLRYMTAAPVMWHLNGLIAFPSRSGNTNGRTFWTHRKKDGGIIYKLPTVSLGNDIQDGCLNSLGVVRNLGI